MMMVVFFSPCQFRPAQLAFEKHLGRGLHAGLLLLQFVQPGQLSIVEPAVADQD